MATPAYQLADDARGMRLVGHYDFDGRGDGMHVNLKDGYAFFAHHGQGGTSVVDVRDPSDPRFVANIPAPPNTHSHKVQVVGDILLVNREKAGRRLGGTDHESWTAGIGVYDVADPTRPREIAFWSCGGDGVHRMTWWDGPYAYASAGSGDFTAQFLSVIDLSDPARPTEAGRWWFPGMRNGEEEQRTWDPADRAVKFHHGLPFGDRLYTGWWDLGIAILDISDPTSPSLVSHLDLEAVDPPSRNTHTMLPLRGRDVAVVTDEATGRVDIPYQTRLVDISDETAPRLIGRMPVPEGDFATRGDRFGPHNVHEPRPGSFDDPDLLFLTYFNAGVRVYDLRDLAAPEEVAWFVPKAPRGRPTVQMNDIHVSADGLVYATDRHAGGLYILELA